ncbi:MAG: phosphatidate cytidylyltransferase [Nitrospinota bacterium]
MTRVLSAVVALPPLILLVRYGKPLHFSFLVSAAAAAGTWEILRLAKFPGGALSLGFGCAAGAALAFGGHLSPPPAAPLAVWTVLLVSFSASVWLPPGAKLAPRGIAGGIAGILFVGATFASLALLRNWGEGAEGWRWVFFLWLVVWGGDTGAYYGGRSWGRRPLSPRLSPKKTVEGAVAGLAASVAGGTLARLWFLPGPGWLETTVAAVLLGAAGQVGDLAESALKRAAGVKDAGAVIPGHGGILDRLDSLTFAGPVLYVFLLWGFP